MSRKRILPAFLLCFVLCAHRIYAGRYISGIVQIAWAVGAFLWVQAALGDLIAIVHSAPFSLDTIEQVNEWEQTHSLPVLPMLALFAVGIWIAVDAGRLLAGKFTDGQGNKITQWT